MTPPRPGQERPGGVVQTDELVLVEVTRIDVLLEELDVLLADVVEPAAVLVAVGVVAHDPPPATTPTPAGMPSGGCEPTPRPVAMLKAPVPCSRWLWPSRMTSGRV